MLSRLPEEGRNALHKKRGVLRVEPLGPKSSQNPSSQKNPRKSKIRVFYSSCESEEAGGWGGRFSEGQLRKRIVRHLVEKKCWRGNCVLHKSRCNRKNFKMGGNGLPIRHERSTKRQKKKTLPLKKDRNVARSKKRRQLASKEGRIARKFVGG